MMIIDALASMRCPYCRARLEFEAVAAAPGQHGTARCDCYCYPIVDGILVARQLSGRSDAVDPVVEALRTGEVDAARGLLRRRTSMVGRADGSTRIARLASRLRLAAAATRAPIDRRRRKVPSGGVAPVRDALESTRPGGFASYLFQRYANPSFAAALPAIAALDRADAPGSGLPHVLDLACGVGHSTFALSALLPDAQVVAVDPDFANLELLRRHFAPDAICVCADAELPLPFDDDLFDGVVCLDAFHYIRSKWALARELDRVATADGTFVLPHLHNALVENFAPGIPLTPKSYLRMFDFVDARLYSESAILDHAVNDRVLDLTADPLPDDLARVPNLTLVASRRDAVFAIHRLDGRSASFGALGINPIYDVVLEGDHATLRAAWPDPTLERECGDIHLHLPRTTTIGLGLLTRISGGALSEDDHAAVDGLRARSILVELPAGYERLDATIRRIRSTGTT